MRVQFWCNDCECLRSYYGRLFDRRYGDIDCWCFIWCNYIDGSELATSGLGMLRDVQLDNEWCITGVFRNDCEPRSITGGL